MFVQFFVMAMVNIYRAAVVVKPDGKEENVQFVRMNVKLLIATEMVYVLMEFVIAILDSKEMIVNKVFIFNENNHNCYGEN